MESIFPHIAEHKTYRNSFLQQVGVAMVYTTRTKKNVPENFDDKMASFMDRFFRMQYNGDFLDRPFLAVKNPDINVRFEFAPEYAYLTVGRSEYKSFIESVLPYTVAQKVLAFEVLGLSNLSNLSIRKINMFPFGASSDTMVRNDSGTVYSNLLSKAFIDTPIKETIEGATNYITPVEERSIEDGNRMYRFKTGIIADKTLKGRYFLILDSSVQYFPNIKISEGTIDRRLIEQNDLLYDVFHWCVSDNVISLMNK